MKIYINTLNLTKYNYADKLVFELIENQVSKILILNISGRYTCFKTCEIC